MHVVGYACGYTQVPKLRSGGHIKLRISFLSLFPVVNVFRFYFLRFRFLQLLDLCFRDLT